MRSKCKKILDKAYRNRNRPTDRQTDRRFRSAWSIADLLGIERRKSKDGIYQDLLKGNIPSEFYEDMPIRVQQIFGKMKHKENGIETNEYSKMYDKSRYRYFLKADFEISDMCCKVMKKQPVHQYGKRTGRFPMTGQMATESVLRASNWVRNGCNGFDLTNPISNPLAFWTDQDVLLYIYENDLEICSVYGDVVVDYAAMGQVDGQMSFSDFGIFDKERPSLKCTGCQRTGCMLCGFGCHLEKPGEGRFEKLKQTHPKMYDLLDVVKNNGVTMREAIEWVNEHGNLNIRL